MSLLWVEQEEEFQKLVEAAFQRESQSKADYFATLSSKALRIVYRDTRYNVDYLYTSYLLDDQKIMEDYAAWLYRLMASILKDMTPEALADYIVDHLDAIYQSIPEVVAPEKQAPLQALVVLAQKRVREAAAAGEALRGPSSPRPSQYEAEIREYMDSLFQRDSRKPVYLVQKFTQAGIPLSNIYVEILAESMRRVGDLWHKGEITVDTEHYCTSVTQMAMAQMYPLLFEGERKNKVLLCACPGTELHEMGARMVADLFEQDGWDSIYLGAAVPEDALLDAIEANRPDLVALSVTMPQHLVACREMVESIRTAFPQQTIAVGGKAFESTQGLWEKWPVDLYAMDARQLLSQANALCDGA